MPAIAAFVGALPPVTLHRRAESALAERAAPIARRAHHVARAADPKRPEHATTLIAAARGALYTSPAVAADHLRVALPLLPEGAEHRHEAQVLPARARLPAGDAFESRALLDALRCSLPGGPPGEAGTPADSSRTEDWRRPWPAATRLAVNGPRPRPTATSPQADARPHSCAPVTDWSRNVSMHARSASRPRKRRVSRPLRAR
ncbi:MAG TPA: hypothetical protein VGX23_10820 [Actinocrinis sp.]|nr:hypothetical protein [Actinocrinis sp.]